MADWNEKMLDEELEAIMNDVPEQEDLEKKINQIINRRIRKVVIKTISTFVILILVLVLGINPLMNVSFWNPYEMWKNEELLTVLGNFVDMTQPWSELYFVNVEKKGFARYEMELQVVDYTEQWKLGKANVTADIRCGKYAEIQDPDERLTITLNRFDMTDWEFDASAIIQDIETLPESALIYLDVSSKEEKTMDHIQNAGVDVGWIQVYQPTVSFNGGIRLTDSFRDDFEVNITETMTDEQLLELYLSNLENLLEHPEVWEGLSLCDGRSWVFAQGAEVLQDTYENAKELEIITTKNYCISGQRDEVLTYLRANEFTNIRVENVRLSLFE